MMHGPQQLRFNAIITVSLRLISQLPLFAMPGGVADLCLAGWMSTSAGDTLYTVDVVTFNGTLLYSSEVRGDITVSKVVSNDRLRAHPLQQGQYYEFVCGVNILRPEMQISTCLDAKSNRDRITVMRIFYIDTLEVSAMEFDEQTVLDYFEQIPGFEWLRYDRGEAGTRPPEFLVKFEDPAAAQNAAQLTRHTSPELKPEHAKTSLDKSDATHFHRAFEDVLAGA